jgi:U3 small nucleolar RNA-associated protein 22
MLSRKSYEQSPNDIERAMFLATSYDKASEAWTKLSPSKPVGDLFFLVEPKI